MNINYHKKQRAKRGKVLYASDVNSPTLTLLKCKTIGANPVQISIGQTYAITNPY
jgi:hypothetical protein